MGEVHGNLTVLMSRVCDETSKRVRHCLLSYALLINRPGLTSQVGYRRVFLLGREVFKLSALFGLLLKST